MKLIICLFIFFSKILFAQNNFDFPKSFVIENDLKTENVLNKYSQFDFSNIWLNTEDLNIYGIIGDDYQRINVKILVVKKNGKNKHQYNVRGKSKVKGIVRDFTGIINLTEIIEFKKFHFGVDEEFANQGIKSQGIFIANYEFEENKNQNRSGIFKGKLYGKWYLNDKNEIKYDDIELNSDNYFNNAFVGYWKSYKNDRKKICNWGDYRVPNAKKGFDIGVGEFNVSEKYWDKGWLNVDVKNHNTNGSFEGNKKSDRSKKWWE